jgi:hypothetical protein
MGYCTVQNVSDTIANAMVQGHAGDGVTTPVPLINRGQLPTSTVSDTLIEDFISRADERIDSLLSSIYDIPLRRYVVSEHMLSSDISAGSSTLNLTDTSRLVEGQEIILVDSLGTEYVVILNIPQPGLVTLTAAVSRAFTIASFSRAQRLDYPPPVPLISRYMSSANLYDKYFAAQQVPNQSDYGNNLRKHALASMNDVLAGRTTLHGQHRIGMRFASPTLLNEHNLSAADMRTTENT